MPPTTPYTPNLGDRDPIEAIRQTTDRVETLVAPWPAAAFERTYAPGKWSARLILTHLAQVEMALGTRARMAVTTRGYVAQPLDQDAWMAHESGLSGSAALQVFVALARMNMVFFQGLSAEDRAKALSHPEYGELTVDWVIHHLAGHQIHHLHQLEQLAESRH
jgi:DinB superfamily